MSQYNKVTPELIEALKAAVPGRISVNGDINEDFSHDEMPIYGKAMPEVVAECLTTEEVAAVMKLCNENRVPVTPGAPAPASLAARWPSTAAWFCPPPR